MPTKEFVFNKVKELLESKNIAVEKIDDCRPWGGFFVIKDEDTLKFVELFFKEISESEDIKGNISPKILLVAPEKKLSWQYHFRRSEIWKLIDGEAALVRSNTDIEGAVETLQINETVKLFQGERHRLIGLQQWGIIAEIWIHTDVNNPSNEEDIVRIQDDFGR